MPSGLSSIWTEMNGINDNNSLELLEFARFRRTTPDELAYFNDHADRHKSYYVNGKEFIMTPEEYDDNADSLSSFPGIPIGTGTDEDVVGYISQDGKKVKFIEIPGGAFMVAYIGDDVSGIARTFYYADINELLFKANPYHKILDGAKNPRGKSSQMHGVYLPRPRKYRYAYIFDDTLHCNYAQEERPRVDELLEIASCCSGTHEVYDNRYDEWYTCPICTGKLLRIYKDENGNTIRIDDNKKEENKHNVVSLW